MEFHETTEVPWKVEWHEIPWNSRATKWAITKFHRIPWNSMELWCRQMQYHSVPWNSMEYSMEFHELWCRQMTYHLVPWNSMEHSMEFHGTLLPPNEVSLSSMEFHGTLRLSFYDLLPWTSKDYSTEFQGILESPNKKIIKKSPRSMGFHGIRRAQFKWHMFHGIPCYIPWKSGAAKWNIT